MAVDANVQGPVQNVMLRLGAVAGSICCNFLPFFLTHCGGQQLYPPLVCVLRMLRIHCGFQMCPMRPMKVV